MTQARVDLSSAFAGMESLAGPIRESLARSMAVAGGQVIRDDAKDRAPRGDTGALADSIYLAYKPHRSNESEQVYSITWNSKKGPRTDISKSSGTGSRSSFFCSPDGSYVTTTLRRKQPKWIAADPFLGPALTGSAAPAYAAIIKRGSERFLELLAGAGGDANDDA